jgi:hypothetical protein
LLVTLVHWLMFVNMGAGGNRFEVCGALFTVRIYNGF